MDNIKDRGANTEEYWKLRLHRLETMQEKTAGELLTDMRKVYQNAMSDLDKEIQAFYGRYAKENGLTMQEVHKRLNPKELDKAIVEIKRYYEFADPTKMNPQMAQSYRDKLRLLSARAYMSRLEEVKMRLENIMVRLAAKEEADYTQKLGKIYAETHSRTSYTIDKTLGFSEGYSAPSDRTLNKALQEKWLGRNFSENIWTSKGRLLNFIQTDLLSGIALGHNPRKIAEAMEKSMNADYKNCERLARTETLHFMNQATLDAYKEHGVEQYEYICGLDERTCPICGELDGKVFDVRYKEEGVNYPVMHPNCVLGDSVILAPDAECLTKSEYSGDIFKISTANGRGFSVTPNHIMLTARGWVRAKNLVKGDKVIYYSAWDKVADISNPANNNGVPTIEQLFASLAESFSMFRRVMPAAAEDFKGDVIKDSEINIILIDSLLRNKADVSLLKFLSDFRFIETRESGKSVLNSDCTLAKLLVCLGLVADGIMSGSSIASVFFGSTLTHHQLVSLRLSSDYNMRLIRSAPNCGSRNSETLGKLVDTFSQIVQFDDIVDVKRCDFSGQVYDISSESTLYICNGFISSNCRCSTVIAKDDIDRLIENLDRENGFEVPERMSYEEWKEKNSK